MDLIIPAAEYEAVSDVSYSPRNKIYSLLKEGGGIGHNSPE